MWSHLTQEHFVRVPKDTSGNTTPHIVSTMIIKPDIKIAQGFTSETGTVYEHQLICKTKMYI